jgi:hypothetical protein
MVDIPGSNPGGPIYMEYAQYILKPIKERVMVPHFLLTIALLAALYFSFLLNLRFLNFPLKPLENLAVIGLLFVALMIDIMIKLARARKREYRFYPDRIEMVDHKSQTVQLMGLAQPTLQRNLFDVLFGTVKVVFDKKTKITDIPDNNQVINYIQRLVQSRNYG